MGVVGCRWMQLSSWVQMDAVECSWVHMNAVECSWVQMGAEGCRWGQMGVVGCSLLFDRRSPPLFALGERSRLVNIHTVVNALIGRGSDELSVCCHGNGP